MRLKSEEARAAPSNDHTSNEDSTGSPPSPVVADGSPTFLAVLDEFSPKLKFPISVKGLEDMVWPNPADKNEDELEQHSDASPELSPIIHRKHENYAKKPFQRVRIQSASAVHSNPSRIRSWSLNSKQALKKSPASKEPSSTHSTPALSR